MFEQNVLSVSSIPTRNQPNRPLPILEVEFRIPILDPIIEEKNKRINNKHIKTNTEKYTNKLQISIETSTRNTCLMSTFII